MEVTIRNVYHENGPRSAARCRQSLQVTDSPRVNFTCLQLDTSTRDVIPSSGGMTYEIRTVNSISKAGGTSLYAVLSS